MSLGSARVAMLVELQALTSDIENDVHDQYQVEKPGPETRATDGGSAGSDGSTAGSAGAVSRTPMLLRSSSGLRLEQGFDGAALVHGPISFSRSIQR